MMRAATFAGALAGLCFGLGLAVAQMTNPDKVLAFLDITSPAWDPSLLFVLGGAVGVHGFGLWLLRRRSAPLFDVGFHPPAATRIDAPLLIGAAIFGIGWGLAGYCPGPAIATLAVANPELLWFAPGLLGGFVLHRLLHRVRQPIGSDAQADAG